MAKTNAELQQAYRQRFYEAENVRLDLVISLDAKLSIRRIARHLGITQRGAIEAVMKQAEFDLIKTIADSEREHYLRRFPRGEEITG